MTRGSKNISIFREHIHYVYKIINIKNGKEYIGLHSTFDIDDNYFGSGYALKEAIAKYGKKHFKKIILFKFKTRQEAIEKEKELVTHEYIRKKNTYNLIVGGVGFDNYNGINKDKFKAPGFVCDYEKPIQFYIEREKMLAFKNKIDVTMDDNSRNLIIFRKQAALMFLQKIENYIDTLTNEWNDKRFHSYAYSFIRLVWRMGFNEFISARELKAT